MVAGCAIGHLRTSRWEGVSCRLSSPQERRATSPRRARGSTDALKPSILVAMPRRANSTGETSGDTARG
eukprot:9668160-Alexandrium_andersonii.AAC.1